MGHPGCRASLGPGRGVLLLVLFLAPALVFAPAGGAAPTRSAVVEATPSRTPPAPLTLLAQTPWVSKDRPFTVQLEAGKGAPPTAQLGVSVDVYPCLSSVSAFDQSVAAPPAGSPISSTRAPLPVSGLPATAGGGFELSLPVKVDDAQAASPAGGFTIDLASVADQCGLYPAGVYPVRIDLVDTADGQAVGGITTHLIYTDAPASTQKLRFALVLPVRTAIVAAPAPKVSQLQARPAAALAAPSATAVAALVGTIGAVTRNPTVPVTLMTNAQAVGALQSTGHQGAVNQLAALAADPAVHQFASSTFAPVNASALVAAGLSDELAMQVTRGTAVVSAQVTHLATVPGHLGAWISDRGLDTTALDQLQADGYSQVIMPAGSVSSPPTNGSTAKPFVLATSGAPMTAFASNLSARFTQPAGNPVLAAHQLVAELAQIYYEQPNDDTARAIVAVPPGSWSDDPSFVNALLGALAGNPIIQPVTVSKLFDSFPASTACRNACRLLSGTGDAGLPAGAIRTQRQRIDSFAVAAPTAPSLSAAFGELVLAGESALLRPAQQSAVLRNARSAVDAQLAQLEVASGQSLTLTSQQGKLPIDIVSSAPYPVRATLTVTSDKLLFANGTTGWRGPTTVLPGHSHTNVVYVNVRARTSGVFTVDVTLDSPAGGLQLSSGQIVVRSTATSIVGIVLSLGAVLVLAAWWVRTSRKRRSLRLAEDGSAGSDPPVDDR